MSSDWEGLLLLDKPQGITSHDVVDAVRRRTGQRRVGHAGTLDPLATGLLPLLLGRATRLARFLPDSPKVYSGRIVLGITTRTDDVEGEVRHRYAGPLPPGGDVLAAAGEVRRRTEQVPPQVSARKVGGERSYRLVRKGETVEARATPVTVSRFDLTPTEDPAEWTFEVEVSAGTYVRALARDLGEALGCGGAVRELRRLRIGPFDVGSACAATADLEGRVVPLADIPLSVPSVLLDRASEALRFSRGVAVEAPRAGEPQPATCRVLGPAGQVLGIGDVASGLLHPRVVLPGPDAAP